MPAELELTPQQIYDEYKALGFENYPRALLVENAAYEAADSGDDERAGRLFYLAEQLYIKQRLYFQFSHELTDRPAGARIRKRYTGKRNEISRA